MNFTGPDGHPWDANRRWWPWRVARRQRAIEPAVVLQPAGALLPAEVLDLVLRLLLLPVVSVLRAVHVTRWPVELWRGDDLVHAESVRGWSRSGDRLHEMAEAIRRGEPPGPARRTDDGGATT